MEMRSRKIGFEDKFYVSSAIACDVLDYYSEIYVTVKTPSRKNLLSSASCEETQYFTATEYGTYTITYYAVDKSGNPTEEKFNVLVVDTVKPEVNVEKLEKTTIALGQEIVVPNITVQDDKDQNPTVLCTVEYMDDMTYEKVVCGEKYTPTKAGKYKIMYYVFDANYNAVYYEIYFVVEG